MPIFAISFMWNSTSKHLSCLLQDRFHKHLANVTKNEHFVVPSCLSPQLLRIFYSYCSWQLFRMTLCSSLLAFSSLFSFIYCFNFFFFSSFSVTFIIIFKEWMKVLKGGLDRQEDQDVWFKPLLLFLVVLLLKVNLDYFRATQNELLNLQRK